MFKVIALIGAIALIGLVGLVFCGLVLDRIYATSTETAPPAKVARLEVRPMPADCRVTEAPDGTPLPRSEWKELLNNAVFEGNLGYKAIFALPGDQYMTIWIAGPKDGKNVREVWDDGYLYDNHGYSLDVISDSDHQQLVGPIFLFSCNGKIYVNDAHRK